MRWYWRAIIACLTVTMLRKTLTIFSLMGLLLSGGLWGVSYLDIYYTYSVNGRGSRSVFLQGGVFGHANFKGYTVEEPGDISVQGFRSFATGWVPHFGRVSVIPLWIPTLLFAALFLSCRPFHFHRRRKRKRLGLCLKCGYDLRASEARCPECGNEFQAT